MSLKEKTISGVKWTTVSTVATAVVSMAKISVLARFLDRGDFGLMALVTFILGFMNLFMDMGLTSAILHKQGISDKEYASLYWINVIFSILLFGLLILASSPIANFYNEPELKILIPLMAISIIISALGRQFMTIEQKHLNFRFIALTNIGGTVLSMGVGITLAIIGFGVYSLVYAALTQYALTNGIFFIKGMIDRGLLFHFNYKETKPFLRIGIYQVGGQAVNYFNRDLDILLIGKFFGSEVLGGYSLAKQLVQKPMMILNPIITTVASPVLSLFQNDKSELKKKYLSFLNIISTANFTAYALLALLAYPVVLIVYGPDFIHIVTVVQILSGYMYLRSLGNPVGTLLIATGKTNYGFYWNLFLLAIMPGAIFIGSQYSIEAVALSLVIVMILLFFLAWKLLIYRLIKASFNEYLYAVIPRWKRMSLLILNEIPFFKKSG